MSQVRSSLNSGVSRYIDPNYYIKDGRKTEVLTQFHYGGGHDQKSHGNWATGGLSDEGGVEDFRSTFEGAFDPHGMMDKNPKIGRAGSMALDTIASIHGIEPDWPKAISLVDNGEWLGEDEGSLGAYMPPERDADPEKDIPRGRVVMRGTRDEGQMATTLVHELGHHLTLGRGVERFHEEMADLGSPLSDLMDRIAESQTAKDMAEINKNMRAAIASGRGGSEVRDQLGFVEYLQMPEEMFARAYAQYIAVKSGNRAMLGDINKVLKDDNTGGIMQWRPDEFGPIADAMENYLRSRGLLR